MKKIKILIGISTLLAFVFIAASVSADGPDHNQYVPLMGVDPTRTFTPTRTATPTRTPKPTRTPTNTPTTNPARSAPAFTNSIYVNTVKSSTLYNLGCKQGKQDAALAGKQNSLVILDFGKTKKFTRDGTTYLGTKLLFVSTYATMSEIAVATENYAKGYLACSGTDTTSFLRIGIGTNNYAYYDNGVPDAAVTAEHGLAWAKMINTVNAWLAGNGYTSRLEAVGASDIETGWNYYADTKKWVDGYNSLKGDYPLYNFGDAGGCPFANRPSWLCRGFSDWTPDGVWYVSFGSGKAYPVPEIYAEDGVHAAQWYWLSKLAVEKHGAPIYFKGVMTQYQDCVGSSASDCVDLMNKPDVGWLQLYDELNANSKTAQGISYSTDIVTIKSSDTLIPTNDAETDGEAVALEKMLENPDLDADARASLQEKLRMALTSLENRKNAVDRGPYDPSEAPEQDDPPVMVGIFGGDDGAFDPKYTSIQNYWTGVANNQFLSIYAGASVEKPQEGLVAVVITSANRDNTTLQYFIPASAHGSLKVLAENNLVLTLQAADGDTMYFDAGTLQFVEAP